MTCPQDSILYLDGVDLGLNEKSGVLNGFSKSDSVALWNLFALTPDNLYDVEVAETDDERRNDEYVSCQKGEVGLALPPGRVASTQTFVFDVTLRIDANCNL